MHIFFVDESGTPPKPEQRNAARYFVVGGVIIPETGWHRIRDDIMGMKTRMRIRGEIKWRYFAPGNTDPANPMRHLPQGDRDAVRTELYRILSAAQFVKSIFAVCSATAAYRMDSVNNQDDIYHLSYKTVSERFQYYLQDTKKETSRDEYGIVIADQRGAADDKRLRAHHQMLVHSSAGNTSKYTNLIESVLTQPSHMSIGIQLADMCAGAVWRKFERGDSRWYDLMEPTLRRSRSGQIDGFGIVKAPKAGWI